MLGYPQELQMWPPKLTSQIFSVFEIKRFFFLMFSHSSTVQFLITKNFFEMIFK